IDDGLVNDVEKLEKLATLAYTKGQHGPPIDDPFSAEEPEPAAAVPALKSQIPDLKSTPSSSDAPRTRAPPVAPPISFPFDAVSAMADTALASGVRTLLK